MHGKASDRPAGWQTAAQWYESSRTRRASYRGWSGYPHPTGWTPPGPRAILGRERFKFLLGDRVHGDRISVVHLNGAGDVVDYEVFIGGLFDPANARFASRQRYSPRPVDLIVLEDGSLLISDDWAGLIYRVVYDSRSWIGSRHWRILRSATLGALMAADSLVIRWPSGTVGRYARAAGRRIWRAIERIVPTDQRTRLHEPNPEPRAGIDARTRLGRGVRDLDARRCGSPDHGRYAARWHGRSGVCRRRPHSSRRL